MTDKTKIFILILIIPSLFGALFSYSCNVKKTSGDIVNIRPAPEIFGIVWPILYLLLGLSWNYARNSINKDEISLELLKF